MVRRSGVSAPSTGATPTSSRTGSVRSRRPGPPRRCFWILTVNDANGRNDGVSSIKTAIIGTGFMGPVHTEALRRIGVDVAGILGSSAEKSQTAAQRLGIVKAYANYAEV